MNACVVILQLLNGEVSVEELQEIGVGSGICEVLASGLDRAAAACKDAEQVKSPVRLRFE